MEQRRNLLDATRSEHNRRERRRLLRSSMCFAIISLTSAWEASHQNLTRLIVSCPEWWFAWVVFGVPSLAFFTLAISRLMLAQSLGSFPGWNENTLARLPPSVARLMGLPSREVLRRNRGFALGGGVLFGRGGSGGPDETAMTTPEVLRSTTRSYRDGLKSRSAARNGTTPQRQRLGGDSIEGTPASKTPDGRRLFSSVDTFSAFMAPARQLTPLETAEIARRSLSIRPQDVGKMIQEYKDRCAKAEPAPQQGKSSPSQMSLSSLSYTASQGPSMGLSGYGRNGMGEELRGYYSHYPTADTGDFGAGYSTIPYQVYVQDAEVTSRRNGVDAERDSAKQLLIRLGIAGKADDYSTNVKTYVVRLMRGFLRQFDKICSLLHARGVAEELLLQQLHRQPQLKLKNSPRVFFNLSLKDMAAQFGQVADFWVQGSDGNPMNLFQKYQHLEEALQVTAGPGVVGVGNPAYVLERLRVLAEDDFMSAFDYDRGGGYPAGMEWSENLPTDAAVVMKLFVCCSDDLMPKQWETDRPFARQHLVDRQPLKSDAEPGRFFLTRNEALHPPYFFVVANQEVWHALPGHSNVFQAIALFFYSIKTHKSGYLGTGISVTSIVQEIFGS